MVKSKARTVISMHGYATCMVKSMYGQTQSTYGQKHVWSKPKHVRFKACMDTQHAWSEACMVKSKTRTVKSMYGNAKCMVKSMYGWWLHNMHGRATILPAAISLYCFVVIKLLSRIGQNRIYTPYMTVYLVIFLPKLPYIHRIYMVLANPNYKYHPRKLPKGRFAQRCLTWIHSFCFFCEIFTNIISDDCS